MAKYKNVTKEDLNVPGHGIIKSGETVELPDTFRNGNFERVEPRKEKPKEEES
jgi:hypothetical protein